MYQFLHPKEQFKKVSQFTHALAQIIVNNISRYQEPNANIRGSVCNNVTQISSSASEKFLTQNSVNAGASVDSGKTIRVQNGKSFVEGGLAGKSSGTVTSTVSSKRPSTAKTTKHYK